MDNIAQQHNNTTTQQHNNNNNNNTTTTTTTTTCYCSSWRPLEAGIPGWPPQVSGRKIGNPVD